MACAGVPVLGVDKPFAEVDPGDVIAIDAMPRVGGSKCTLMACGERQCCNRCSAAYSITTVGADRTATAIQLAGIDGCTGTECGLDCKPFGRKPTHTYRFVGRLSEEAAQSGERYLFEVDRFCAAAPATTEPEGDRRARDGDASDADNDEADEDELDPNDQEMLDDLLDDE